EQSAAREAESERRRVCDEIRTVFDYVRLNRDAEAQPMSSRFEIGRDGIDVEQTRVEHEIGIDVFDCAMQCAPSIVTESAASVNIDRLNVRILRAKTIGIVKARAFREREDDVE